MDASLKVLEELKGKMGWTGNPEMGQKATQHLRKWRDKSREHFYCHTFLLPGLPLRAGTSKLTDRSWNHRDVATTGDTF